METPAIELSHLVKRYGSLTALDDVNLSIAAGEIFGFLGPNGAGKTTAMRILLDLIRPTSGWARVAGFDSKTQSVQARTQMGYLPGDLRLYDQLRGQNVIELIGSLRPRKPEEASIHRLCRRLDFDPSRVVGSYSKGNKQKLGLILALMHRPPILVLDEPTSGLDPLGQEAVEELLSGLAAEGHTVFFSSHILSEVEHLCHRVGFIRAGRIVAVEDVGEVKGRSLHILEVTFAGNVPLTAFDIEGVRVLRNEHNLFRLEVRSNLDSTLKTIAQYPVLDLRTEQPSLEDVFLAYYEARQAPAARGGAIDA